MEETKTAGIDNRSRSRKAFFKNIVIVLISNIVSMLSGILIGFIIPKIMGISEYGYYKTFTLYSSYIGILHFGFIDGIYLKFAGKKYEELDKNKFKSYTQFLFIMETIISLMVFFVSFFFLNTTYYLIIIFLSLNIFAKNIVTYYEYIGQVTMRFKRTTARNIIRCALNIISVLVLYLLYKYNDVVIYNYIYVIITLGISYVLTFWYIFTYRDITFGKGTPFKEVKQDLVFFFKVGIPLLLSNLIDQLIFIVDQQFVNIAFDNDTYSLYAFAYNMISLITVATGAISTVLYPTLKTIGESTITDNYSKMNSYLLMFVALCLIAYFPLILIVNNFLPKYNESLNTFVIILPGILISSSISVIKYNCYKTFGQIINYFIKSIIALGAAIVADLIVFNIFGDTRSISIVSIGVLLLWYILVELYFIRAFKVKWIKNLLYIIVVIGSFYGISFIPNLFAGAGAYLSFYLIVTSCFYYKEIKGVLIKLKNRKAAKEVSNAEQ